MSDLRIPSLLDDLARLRLDVDDLLRRTPSLAQPEGEAGCCVSYCCLDTDGFELETGESLATCTFDIDPIGGSGLRLSLDGWARIRIATTGPFAVVSWTSIDATAYDGAPRVDFQAGFTVLDQITIPIGGTYDTAIPDPSVAVNFQNLSTATFQLVQVYARLTVGPREGSQSCGHPHSGTGPL